ncbi:MAG: hypothetical protein ABMA64_43585 [Myxococcota bacterium]
MIPSWTEIKQAPSRWTSHTRDRIRAVRSRGSARLRKWVDAAGSWRVVQPLARVAGRFVARPAAGAPALDGWEGLNARDAIKRTAELDLDSLTAARALEAGAKSRRTVLAAIDARLERLQASETAPAQAS